MLSQSGVEGMQGKRDCDLRTQRKALESGFAGARKSLGSWRISMETKSEKAMSERNRSSLHMFRRTLSPFLRKCAKVSSLSEGGRKQSTKADGGSRFRPLYMRFESVLREETKVLDNSQRRGQTHGTERRTEGRGTPSLRRF
jgi:hypothetical protein